MTAEGVGQTEQAPCVIVDHAGKRYYVPATVARSVVRRPPISPVPGTQLGMVLIGGEVMPVLQLGPEHTEVVICDLGGEALAVSGLNVVESGIYELQGELLVRDQERIARLDVTHRYERIHQELGRRRQVRAERLSEAP